MTATGQTCQLIRVTELKLMGWEDVTPQKRQGIINKTLHSYIIICICQHWVLYYHLNINGQRESLLLMCCYHIFGLVHL